jgi:hypothetical protein
MEFLIGRSQAKKIEIAGSAIDLYPGRPGQNGIAFAILSQGIGFHPPSMGNRLFDSGGAAGPRIAFSHRDTIRTP